VFYTGLTGDIEPATILNNLDFSNRLWSAEERDISVGDFDDTCVERRADGSFAVTGHIVLNLNVMMAQTLDVDQYESERWLNENRDTIGDFLSANYGCRRGGTWEAETFSFYRQASADTAIVNVASMLDSNRDVTNLLDDIHGRNGLNLCEKIQSFVESSR
jgi:hypothetical protein